MKKLINVELKNGNYQVIIESNLLKNIEDYIDLSQRYFIVTDDNVAAYYLETLTSQLKNFDYIVLANGEAAKSFSNLQMILEKLLELNYERTDQIIALGGGVIGDIAGLAASLYMRGIAYINIPTSSLAQIDASVGGKVAIDLAGVKNVIGDFYNSSQVLIDPALTASLAKEHYQAGLVEALKIGLTSNSKLVSMLEADAEYNLIVNQAIRTKLSIVKEDEMDLGLRNILNFGHTFGHALEVKYNLIHGEAVFYGMYYDDISSDIKNILDKFKEKFDYKREFATDGLMDLMINDKKVSKDMCSLIKLDKVGAGTVARYPLAYLKEKL